ncbi:gliding motility-associated C-terminal domain-containing protein [Myroides marinus]|uniref:gliding motility-associated C-terminal domain-containing protein n=1 Tax=Myroides marinus TaxID=703342 RepID=UPI002575A9E7|nr:gliding motility-associated C-terminal domain-containing protein [Myroides marinus]MDM1384181.1 gliding motility-associated C-terminal domain-containing protein [Myroides marinus]MDM1390794.1 gliding motility-associated C-terminal domain-containing protein [Myroides marinus]MDM1533046.1 gliding motility-associated C-terminal domain-containing protein [Myroides marinus]MDM1539977.1 gliding motility-associated C-terminal domain-containing protein [Myroides marinus]
MQSRKLYKSVALLGLALPATTAVAQQAKKDQVMVNQGKISVAEGGVMSTIYDFDNTAEGYVKNDGTVYYYSNFNNDNIYDHSNNVKSSKAVFTHFENSTGVQHITGDKLSNFYDVELNNTTSDMAFDLKNEMNVRGSVDFKDGIIKVDSLKGMLTFHQGAKALKPTDNSHAEGYVEKIGNEEFQYPKGDKGLYRYARITAPDHVKDAYEGKYNLDDKNFFRARNAKSGVIDILDQREYWTIDKGSDNSEGNIMLTLSWDERTTPKELLVNPEKELHIVRWDAKQQLWVDEGGVVDLANKEITTPATVKGYGFFTLATVKTDLLLDGDIVIYNLVTPDGDGKNDYFIIDNINKFPNNSVEIYNRWGVKVYDTKNYDSAGNVFRGYSDGRVTINKGEKLPTGTYFYIVNYEFKDKSGSRMIKKSGYLHLESNK